MNKFFKVLIIFGIIFIILFIGFAALGFFRRYEKNRTDEAILRINSRKITLEDVMGNNFPPKPDQALNDSTIAGIDANNNFIRDDVELAIFEKYPNSAKIRAAMLQYAQALQLDLIKTYNQETWVATQKKEENAYQCLGYAISENEHYSVSSGPKDFLEIVGFEDIKLMGLVINTELRNKKFFNENGGYKSPYSSDQDNYCDIDISLLQN